MFQILRNGRRICDLSDADMFFLWNASLDCKKSTALSDGQLDILRHKLSDVCDEAVEETENVEEI